MAALSLGPGFEIPGAEPVQEGTSAVSQYDYQVWLILYGSNFHSEMILQKDLPSLP
jgi:hypothetical protein